MDNTTKAILEMIVSEVNDVMYRYSQAQLRHWDEVLGELEEGAFWLEFLLRKSCELAGVEYEHHEVETGDLAFEVYSIIYPAKTETPKGSDA